MFNLPCGFLSLLSSALSNQQTPGDRLGFDVLALRKLVSLGKKNGSAPEVEMGVASGIFRFYGLIDYDCMRIYAVKVVITSDTYSSIHFVEFPLYGKVDEVGPNGNIPVPKVPEGFAPQTQDLTPYVPANTPFPKLRTVTLFVVL